MILPDSNEAARKVTVVGWVSRDNRFFGEDECTARWSGATHVRCTTCGTPTEKSWTVCKPCRDKKDLDKYARRDKKEWDGSGMVYSETLDRFFVGSEVDDLCEDEGTTAEQLRLVICEPVFAKPIAPRDHYEDNLPEDGEVPAEVQDAFDELNRRLQTCRVPLCWVPGEYAVA